MAAIVGIDLGTTNSLCAVFQEGQPRLIPNVHGRFLTPSVVGVLDDGQVVVGASAKELRVTRPERCAWCFKRYMGSGRTLTVAGKTYTAPELSSLVLRSLKHDAEVFLGQTVEEAVITVPAYFNDLQRKATKLAGEMAGFNVRRIINEPTAAALVYGFHARDAQKQLVVIDLGGGTFDVTLMEVFEGTLEIVSTAGESMLGGEDFTDKLVAAVLQREKTNLEVAELKQPLRVARLRQECEVAKCQLFQGDAARVRVPDANGEFTASESAFKITREGFAKLVEPLMERIRRPIDKALRDADCPPDRIDEVILAGGATRMAVMVSHVEKYFGKPPRIEFNPDEVVALGAAIQAALVKNDVAVSDMVMTNVCPFTLGVEVVKEFGGQMMQGYFSPIIHRNTTIPVSREEVYSTVTTNQQTVCLKVFQGESRRTKDNLELGELTIENLPPGPAGTPVHVRFSYDLNGILEVEAFVPDSGRKFRTVLTNHVRGLSPEEIEEGVRRLQALKFYPRDDERNKRLVLFCERAVGELGPHHRQTLEQALDVFEHALSSGDRELYANARRGLLMVLSQLGIEYDEHQADVDGS
jgi:molecular chaperone HscC